MTKHRGYLSPLAGTAYRRNRHARHIWGAYQQHVTPFANVYRRGYYGGWDHPELARERAFAANLARWSSPTVTDHGRYATNVGALCKGESFRQVDVHGATFGPRLFATDRAALDDRNRTWWINLTDDLREILLREDTRVRRVDRQDEDPHSRACRALKAQWRQTRNDRSQT